MAPLASVALGVRICLRGWEDHESLLQRHQRKAAAMLQERSGRRPAHIDLLYIQDAYTPAVLNALENYGFCDEGEAGEFIQDGRTALGGALPVNINGGQTSETYMVGLGHTVDAIRQLRATQANARLPAPGPQWLPTPAVSATTRLQPSTSATMPEPAHGDAIFAPFRRRPAPRSYASRAVSIVATGMHRPRRHAPNAFPRTSSGPSFRAAVPS